METSGEPPEGPKPLITEEKTRQERLKGFRLVEKLSQPVQVLVSDLSSDLLERDFHDELDADETRKALFTGILEAEGLSDEEIVDVFNFFGLQPIKI